MGHKNHIDTLVISADSPSDLTEKVNKELRQGDKVVSLTPMSDYQCYMLVIARNVSNAVIREIINEMEKNKPSESTGEIPF